MNTPVSALSGIGPRRAQLLEKLNVCTVGDLLLLYPRRYEDRSLVTPISELAGRMGETVSIVATVLSPPRERRIRGGRLLTEITVGDGSGVLNLTYFNNPYIKNKLKTDCTFNFYGKADPKRLLHMIAPDAKELEAGEQPGIQPVYPLTGGLNQTLLRRLVRESFARAVWPADPLPEELRRKYDLIGWQEALQAVHFPENPRQLAAARRRLAFEELLYFQLGLGLYADREKEPNHYPVDDWDAGFRSLQPFTPTASQQKATREIIVDMRGSFAMNRLLQGDVGSGKTYVAGEAAYAALRAGYQIAVMAPTEILARQHAAYFQPLFEKLGYRTALLVGAMSAAEKRAVYAALAAGEIDLIIGTHTLFQKQVRFARLGLVIADEQHRFGVKQRAALAAKGGRPHVLVMSATPIPRTMALMVWGDLSLSVLDTLPAGRREIQTFLVDSSYRPRLRAFMEKQIAAGGQVYIVCPLVEEDEETDLQSVEALFDDLKRSYGAQVGLIHGKLRPDVKEEAMRRFVEGETKILISTTVIEVGINVPRATLMILENAERFGLSQLHQLRGRVGRGKWQSYCVLISDNRSEKTLERLTYFCETTDGFAISQKDLELRGPGDFFGSEQHGLPKMQLAGTLTDTEPLAAAHRCAERILAHDPALQNSLFAGMKERVNQLFAREDTIFN